MNTRFKYAQSARIALYVMLVVALLLQSVVVAPMLNKAHAQEANTWKFIAETIPDGSCYIPGALFTKSWTVRNIGNITWTPSYTLTFVSGDQMSAPSSVQLTLSNVGKDNDVTISVSMTAPQSVGTYTSNWSIKDTSGNIVYSSNGKSTLWAQIKVATDCTAIVPATQTVSQNGVQTIGTPSPRQFDFYTDGNTAFTYIDSAWVPSTVSPNGKYTFPQISGTINVFEYQECTGQWKWNGWYPSYETVCVKKQRGWQELGLMPVSSIDPAGEAQFYRFINTLSFGAVGTVMGGTLQGVGGYTITEVGAASSISSASVIACMSRFALPVLVVGYVYYAGKVFIVTYPLQPVPVPTAPVTLSGLALQQPRLADAVAAVTALETTMGFTLSTSNFQIGTLALPAEMTANSITMKDVVITLPRGTTVSISFTKAGSQCFHKNTMDILFPWGKESFYGTSGDCSPWGWLEALTNMLKNWSERVRQIMSSPQFADLVAKKVVDVLVLKELIYETTSDLIQLVLELASYLIKGGF